MPRFLPMLIALVSALTAVPAFAQQVTISARAGLLSAGVVPSAVLGANLAVDLTNRVAVEGEVLYFTKARWASATAATGAVRVAVGPFGWADTFVPFVVGGAGVHRASIDLFDRRLLGPIDAASTPGQAFCPSRGSGPGAGPGSGFSGAPCSPGAAATWGVGDLPEYYARRLGTLVVPADRRWPTRSFVDPAVTAGGGFHVHVGDRLVLQPEARIWITMAEGNTRTAGVFSVLAGYGF